MLIDKWYNFNINNLLKVLYVILPLFFFALEINSEARDYKYFYYSYKFDVYFSVPFQFSINNNDIFLNLYFSFSKNISLAALKFS